MRKSKRNRLLFVIIVSLLISGCSEFFEKDLKSDIVQLNAPADNIVTKYTNLTFWWDFVDRADNYNLKIVSPSFSNIEKIVLDTTLTSNTFTYTLSTGIYEWGVAAYNFSSTTVYSTRKLTIDTSSNLKNINIQLLLPTSHYTKENTVNFKWQLVSQANNYRLKTHIEDCGYMSNFRIIIN